MDRHMGASLDQWLTTDPGDDGSECRDAEGNGYPEHDETGDGGLPAECRRCGAELDYEEDE